MPMGVSIQLSRMMDCLYWAPLQRHRECDRPSIEWSHCDFRRRDEAFAVTRLLSNGALDLSFSLDGWNSLPSISARSEAMDVVVQTDEKSWPLETTRRIRLAVFRRAS